MQQALFLILIPSSKGGFCGLADHAVVVSEIALSRGIGSKLVFWWDRYNFISSLPVLVEYTPLSYSRIGLPIHFLFLILLWRLQGRRVVLYFHELPFASCLTSRRRLALRMQRSFCIFLAMLSCESVVNQRSAFGWLRRPWLKRKPIFLPTCSNIGEEQAVSKPQDRPCSVVVFGSPGKRQHAHALMRELGGYSRIFGDAVQVIDIGEPLDASIDIDPDVSCLGPLPAGSVKAAMLSCRFGFFYSEPDQFTKSGVFAAYCATGVVPVIAYHGVPMSKYYLTPSDFIGDGLISDRALNVWLSCRHWAQIHGSQAMSETVISMMGFSVK
jgi:hypothetical protein